MRALTILWRIWRDVRAIAAVEFAMIAPVFILMLMGMMDIGHTLYTQSVLQGVMQKAARDATLETGGLVAQQAAIDAKVTDRISKLVKNPNVALTRRYFKDFTKANAKIPEPDYNNAVPAKNMDGTCETGETYLDTNNNNTWDNDGGDSGQGGAKDIVVYTATVTFPRLLPMYKLAGLSQNTTIKASTVLANQPFGDQAAYAAPTTKACP